MLSPLDFYRQSLRDTALKLHALRRRRNVLTGIRLVLFAAIFFFLYRLATSGNYLWLWSSLLALAGFIAAHATESVLLKKRKYLRLLKKQAETESCYLKGDKKELPAGDEFRDPRHAYAHDLDIFGEDSLFQAIDRTVTPHGRITLADWLLHPLQKQAEILARQELLRQWREHPGWCHEFRATGGCAEISRLDVTQIEAWQKSDISLSRRWMPLLYTLPVISISGWILCILGILGFLHALQISLVLIIVVLLFTKKINAVHNELNRFVRAFGQLYGVIRVLARTPGDAAIAREIRDTLCSHEADARLAFRSLRRTTEAFDQRGNMLAAIILNGLYLKDLFLVIRLSRWKKRWGAAVPAWVEVIGRSDALVSLAGYAFNHPEDIFPALSGQTLLQGKGIGHPLLPRDRCVVNDFEVGKLHEFHIITGANMAGKSTFLRSVGVNLVLAHAGICVRAESFSFQPMTLFTSMRTADNLAKGTSYFHAELIRLKELVELAQHKERLFIILDEILKGTNSTDKLNGSLRFLQRLRSLPISGLVATHDLELGRLAREYPGNYTNHCFEITHTEDDIAYDYLLRPGVSQNMNASILLEKMGLV